MTIILHDDDIDTLEGMKLALAAVETALLARARGMLTAPPRQHVACPGGDIVFTAGAVTAPGSIAGFRAYDTFPHSKQYQVVVVWDTAIGTLKGIVLGSKLGELRTGAIGGIAIKLMSDPGATQVGILGSGAQARTQLLAAMAVRTLTSVRVFSRNSDAQRAFAEAMSSETGLPVESVSSAEEAVHNADIVLCATTSNTPVMRASWLKPGAHINTVGPKSADAHELGLDVADIASLIATDSLEQARAYGDGFFLDGSPHSARIVDLADLAAGTRGARSHGDETTLFCSVGLAGTEVIVADSFIARFSTIDQLSRIR